MHTNARSAYHTCGRTHFSTRLWTCLSWSSSGAEGLQGRVKKSYHKTSTIAMCQLLHEDSPSYAFCLDTSVVRWNTLASLTRTDGPHLHLSNANCLTNGSVVSWDVLGTLMCNQFMSKKSHVRATLRGGCCSEAKPQDGGLFARARVAAMMLFKS
eukprot:384080-Amphidinium_carterae.1